MFATTDVPLDELLDPDKMPNIGNKMAIYWKNLEKFLLLHKRQNS